MKKFVARLEAQDGSGHFRRVAVFSESLEEAKRFLEDRERGYARFKLSDEEKAEIERKLAEGEKLTPAEIQNQVYANQEEPYVLVHIGDTDPPRDPNRKPKAA